MYSFMSNDNLHPINQEILYDLSTYRRRDHYVILSNYIKFFGTSREGTFYLIRLSVGVTGSLGLYYFYTAARDRYGEITAVTAFILSVFNHTIIHMMSRLSLDSTMAILNMYIFGLWLKDRVFLLVFLSVRERELTRQ